ncbi:HEAT repeat domain-containing protein [Sorangium sp. So ce406]|uniref:HEAT repeat domain-containing protein n=1 Tax=Sorangium sp. So ce406 TaxID=3133311 RepID=UPI003F5BB6AC
MKDVNWKKVRHAHGPATRVPAQVEALATGGENARFEAQEALRDTCVQPGAWFEVSAPLVALLIEAAARGTAQTAILLRLLADVIAGEHVAALSAGLPAPANDLAAATRRAAQDGVEAVTPHLDAADPAVRAAAALALAFIPGDAALAALQRRLGSEPEPPVRAGMALALACLARQGAGRAEAIEASLQGEASPLVRLTAALGAMLAGRPAGAGLAGVLEEGLGADVDVETFPWAGGKLEALVPALARGARAGEELVREALLAAVGSAGATGAGRAAVALLGVAGFTERWGEKDVALPEELSGPQRAIAQALAQRDGLKGLGWGVPPSARDRRRWLGVSPPGPLEKALEVPGVGSVPLWYGWRKITQPEGDWPPALVWGALSPVERLDVIVECWLGGYRICEHANRWFYEQYLGPAVAEAGERAVPWAKAKADEIAALYARGSEPERKGDAPPYEVQVVVFDPLLNANVELDPRWDDVLPLFDEVYSRLPAERSEPLVLKALSRDPEDSRDALQWGIEILPQIPARRLAAELARRALGAELRRTFGKETADACLASLEEIGRAHPEVALGIADAKAAVVRA